MLAEAQAVADGAHAVFVHGAALARAARQVVVRILFRLEQTPFDKRQVFVEDAQIAGAGHVAPDAQRQPQVVVRALGAHAPVRRRMPPVLHIALHELVGRAQHQLVVQQLRFCMDGGHRILQLVAEAEGAAGLVVAAARPDAAGDGLVHQPAVGDDVQRRFRRFDVHRTERLFPVGVHGRQRLVRCLGAAVFLHHAAGVGVAAAGDTEHEHDFAFLARQQVERRLDGGAGVEPRPHLAGQARAAHGHRRGQRAVTAQKFGAVGGNGARGGIAIEERHAAGKVGVVLVAGKQRAADRIELGQHVHARLGAHVTQHPFHVTGHRQLARHRRIVAHLDDRVLDRRIGGDERGHLGSDARLGMLEHAVAEAVARGVVASAACRQRRRGPELAGSFVAQVERFAAGVAHRIVMPWRQAELVGVLVPGVGLAAFRDHGAEAGVGQHVGPWRRGALRFAGGDHVFAAVFREAADAVFQLQYLLAARWDDQIAVVARVFAATVVASINGQRRHAQHRRAGALDLLGQRATAVADDHARYRLQQDAVFGGDLVAHAHENAARTVDGLGVDPRGDQPHDLIVQQLAVTRLVFVPDHQVHYQPFQAPVGVGLHHLPHQFDVGRVLDLQQDDRQVAGNCVGPQAGLAAMVFHQGGGVGAQRSVRVDHRAGQAAIQLGVGFGGVQLAQHDLAVGPGQFEHAVGQVAVVVLVDQVQRGVALVGHAGNHVHGRGLVGLQGNGVADCHHRVEHRTFSAGQCGVVQQCLRRGGRVAAADEARAVGFVRDAAHGRIVHGHGMHHVRHGFVAAAWTARAQDGVFGAQNFGLHEQLAERRVGGIGCCRRHHHFGKAGHLDGAHAVGGVGDAGAAQFDVVFR